MSTPTDKNITMAERDVIEVHFFNANTNLKPRDVLVLSISYNMEKSTTEFITFSSAAVIISMNSVIC